jgi:NADH:ubiquinone oxidoreductase subunit 4 (subunit M)
MFVPLTLIIIFFGVYPSPMLDIMNESVKAMVKLIIDSQMIYSSTGF